MSAVPETLFVAPPAAALDGEACRGAQTETLILARCAVQIAAEAGPEAILVESAAVRTAARRCSGPRSKRCRARRCAAPPGAAFERLAHAAGWEHCQYWTDGQSRFAIHVLERAKN